MPRIFAPGDITTTQRLVNFTNGAAAVRDGDTAAIAYFTGLSGAGVTIDYGKHALTPLDKLPRREVAQFADYLGASYAADAKKGTIIRAIETAISGEYLGTLTITSAAQGDLPGGTKVTVSAGSSGTGHKFFYKTAKTTPPALLFGDQPDATWTEFESPVIFVVGKTGAGVDHDKVTVVEVRADTLLVVKQGNQTITMQART